MNRHMSKDEALQLVQAILIKHGANERVADIIADCLVRAECDGVRSHGLARLPDHIASIRAGWANPAALPDIAKVRSGLLRVVRRRMI